MYIGGDVHVHHTVCEIISQVCWLIRIVIIKAKKLQCSLTLSSCISDKTVWILQLGKWRVIIPHETLAIIILLLLYSSCVFMLDIVNLESWQNAAVSKVFFEQKLLCVLLCIVCFGMLASLHGWQSAGLCQSLLAGLDVFVSTCLSPSQSVHPH